MRVIAKQFLYYQRQLQIDLLPIEMALRWLIRLPPINIHSVPATLLLCWKFVTRNIDTKDIYVLGKGKEFAREEWRIFKAMHFDVNNIKNCRFACINKAHLLTARQQKLVIFNIFSKHAGKHSIALRQQNATCAGEIVAIARRRQT